MNESCSESEHSSLVSFTTNVIEEKLSEYKAYFFLSDSRISLQNIGLVCRPKRQVVFLLREGFNKK